MGLWRRLTLDRVSSQLGRKDKTGPQHEVLSTNRTKKTGFSLSFSLHPSLPHPSSLEHPWHGQRNICLLKSHFLSYRPGHHLSLQPRYAATQQIKVAGDLQEGLSQRLLTPESRQDAWLPDWLCCSPRSCLPHCRDRRLILTFFSTDLRPNEQSPETKEGYF